MTHCYGFVCCDTMTQFGDVVDYGTMNIWIMTVLLVGLLFDCGVASMELNLIAMSLDIRPNERGHECTGLPC